MLKLSKLKGSILLELFFDASLLLLFIVQAFLLGCLLTYRHIPIPKNLGDTLIARYGPEGFRLEADSIRLKLNGEIELSRFKIWTDASHHPILEADGAVAEIKRSDQRGFRVSVESLVLANGTLYLPAVYSPDGLRTPILERIAFRLLPAEDLIRIDSFAALHDNIRLRGAIEWPLKSQAAQTSDLNKIIAGFYKHAATALKERARFDVFTRPTLAFDLSLHDDGSVKAFTRVSSRELKHPQVTGKNFRIDASLQIKEEQLITDSPLLLRASELQVPTLELSATSLKGQIEQNELQSLVHGDWPDLELSAQNLFMHEIQLDAPRINVSPKAYPALIFKGSTNGLKGAVEFSGALDALTQSGTVEASGSVDLLALAPSSFTEKLPSISFSKAPYYTMQLVLKEGFSLESANVYADTYGLTLNGITFDHIRSRISFQDSLFSIDDLYLRRDWQWLDLTFGLDRNNSDYRVSLIGSAVPYDYNAILPRWWSSIFRDFDFSEVEESLGDFIIYGNTKKKVADLYYGHASAEKVRFKDVLLDSGELIVRGRGRYAECHQINAKSGKGWARGNIAFASKQDEVKAPASIRLDFESQLRLDDARKLFGGNIATIISDFESDTLPTTTLTGVIFNKAYPKYRGLSYFDLVADSGGPIKFKGVPLEALEFSLYGRNTITHLRDLKFGYAEGHGEAEVDILTPENSPAEVRFQLSLSDADQVKAIKGLPRFSSIQSSVDKPKAALSSKEATKESEVNLNLHARGPVNNPYGFNGYGDFLIRNKQLGSIQLLGPLSKLLKDTPFSFTSFNLNEMKATFQVQQNSLFFSELRIDGPRTRISAPGKMLLDSQALDMRVSVNLFANVGTPDSKIKQVTDLLKSPIPNLLEFQLTGTLQDQKWRSLYDPRNLIPRF